MNTNIWLIITIANHQTFTINKKNQLFLLITCGIVIEFYVEKNSVIMNKIILQIGLLTFCVSVIFFSRSSIPFYDILLKSFAVFIIITIMGHILALLFIQSIKKISENRDDEFLNLKTESKKV